MGNMIETQNVEYKEKFNEKALETLCAFANTNGGTLYIGISDSGEVKGVNVDNESIRNITEKITSKLGIYPEIYVEDRESKKIIKISVKPSLIPISFNGKYYERVGNTTREMTPERLKEFLLKGTNWDGLINKDANFGEIDEETIRAFIRKARSTGRLTIFEEDADIKTIFEHLKLSVKGKLTNASLILFGKDPQKYFINAVLRIVRLKN